MKDARDPLAELRLACQHGTSQRCAIADVERTVGHVPERLELLPAPGERFRAVEGSSAYEEQLGAPPRQQVLAELQPDAAQASGDHVEPFGLQARAARRRAPAHPLERRREALSGAIRHLVLFLVRDELGQDLLGQRALLRAVVSQGHIDVTRCERGVFLSQGSREGRHHGARRNDGAITDAGGVACDHDQARGLVIVTLRQLLTETG
jgi:hypothetical protein